MAAVMKLPPAPLESAQRIAKLRLGEMKTERESWEGHWKELIEYFLTRKGRWLTEGNAQRGNKRNQKLVDPTPKFAARTLGAGMHAGSTNPATPWFRLTTPDPEMMEFPSVSLWLYQVENLMRDIFARSNLYSVLPGLYTEAGVFGTAPMLMLEHRSKVIHFVPKTIGSYYLATNGEGVVDTLFCEYRMTARQMIQEFGYDKVSDTIKSAWKDNKRQVQYDVLHAIEPNVNRTGGYDNQNMAWQSQYFENGAREDQGPLRKSGFEDNPIACFRWETTEITDPYGSSCGMDALGLSKGLQYQTRQKAKAIDKHVDPPMVGDPAMETKPSSLMAGDVTWAGFTATGAAPKFQPAYTIKPEIQGLLMDIEDIRDVIEEAMYTKLFLAITRADPRNATVPEIDARKEEQILALGPVLQNHEDGLIKPIIDRTFNLMARQGRLPPPPPELEGVSLKVELIGALAQAFRSIAAGKLDRFSGYVGNLAKFQADSGQEVTAFDKWDTDQSIDEYAQAIGVPPTVVRGDDDVAALREQRAKAAQAQQIAAAAQPLKDASVAAKNLSETNVNGQSALDQVVNA